MMSITIEFEDDSEEVVQNVESIARAEGGRIFLTRYVKGLDEEGDQEYKEVEFDHGVVTYITTEGYV